MRPIVEVRPRELGAVVAHNRPRIAAVTRDYLSVAADIGPLRLFIIRGEQTYTEKRNLIEDFDYVGGVIIVSDEQLAGLALPIIDRAIHYSTPLSQSDLAKRESHLMKYFQNGPFFRRPDGPQGSNVA